MKNNLPVNEHSADVSVVVETFAAYAVFNKFSSIFHCIFVKLPLIFTNCCVILLVR